MEIGNGAQVAAIDRDVSQGSLMTTGRPFDLAIQGNGFFIVNDGSGESYYTRVGAFGLDSNNTLVDTATGFKVLDRDSKEIKIEYDLQQDGHVTNFLEIAGNLSAQVAMPAELTTKQAFEVNGVAATESAKLNELDRAIPGTDYDADDIIRISGTGANGAEIGVNFECTADSTVGDLVDAISSAFPSATAALVDGEIVVIACAWSAMATSHTAIFSPIHDCGLPTNVDSAVRAFGSHVYYLLRLACYDYSRRVLE